LTKSPPVDFDQTIERLTKQDLSSPPEIVIVNSGNGDMSNYAEKYAAKVFNIPPEEFEHGAARNHGAEKASGEYVFFMSDDAIPASNRLLYDMINLLESDKNVAAATARQIARSDADLMACQALWWHYKMLNLTKDRVVGTAHFDELTATEKRQICQIDDVCSCYRHDILLKYKFAPRLRASRGRGYAEDLELGIRLVRDGYKIAQLYSTGVIHSHNRPATYYLKRTYVDVKTLSGLLEYDMTAIFKQYAVWSRHDNLTVPTALLESVICLYNALSSAIDDLKNHALYGGDISMVLPSIEKQMKGSRTTINRSSETEISNFLDQIAFVAGVKLTGEPRQNIFGERYVASVRMFAEWLLETRPRITGVEDDFIEALYKLLGTQIGAILAEYYLYARRIGLPNERLEDLDRFLSSGI
jgi:glycosyltransferase involved in cell wall biosynthesis